MEYILSLSYGKDSLACFGACEILGWPIDRVVTAEVWATDTLPADLPPMVEFKDHADRIIKERWGIEVEHIRCRNTYQDVFYRRKSTRAKKNPGQIRGWPMRGGPGGAWCQGIVADGVKRTICCPQSIPPPHVVVAGSATIKVWDSSDSCAEITRNCGRSC